MKSHIRLNMIVKNEAHVILRCLASVKPWIDSWVIVDTGSTDGTQDIIKDYLKDVSGQLLERPWKNFGFNRTEALELATHADLPKADYLLFIDADETLLADSHFKWSNLTGTAYYFNCIYDNLRYCRNALVSTQLSWEWKGVLHEYLASPKTHQWQTLDGLTIFIQHDGARAKNADTYLNDIAILEQGILDEPNNLRYLFYLAQSYKDAGLLEKSRTYFLKRASAGGWEEERWMAQFRAAQMADRLKLPSEQVYLEYLQAWIVRQQRAEPLYELARFYRGLRKYDVASYFAQQAVDIVLPKDQLFIDASVYEWRALDELSVSASYCPAYKAQGKKAILRLIKEEKFPSTEKNRIMSNLKYYP